MSKISKSFSYCIFSDLERDLLGAGLRFNNIEFGELIKKENNEIMIILYENSKHSIEVNFTEFQEFLKLAQSDLNGEIKE